MMFLISHFIFNSSIYYIRGGDKKTLKLDEKCVIVEAKDPRNLHDIHVYKISKSSLN